MALKKKLRELKESLTRKVPRDQVPFFCVAGFLVAVVASMLLGTMLAALCEWAVDGMGGGYAWQ